MPPHRVCYSKAVTHFAILDSSFAAWQNWPYSHTAVRNRILRKKKILGIVIGKKEENRMTIFTRHPARDEIGSLRPKHSLCTLCLWQTAFAAASEFVI